MNSRGHARLLEYMIEHPPSFDDGRPLFDQAFAKELIGKYVLVGITRMGADGGNVEMTQYHGTIVSADANDGFRIELCGEREGEYEWLPADTSAFETAAIGDYRLRSTGEIVTSPDYVSSWTVTRPAKK